MQGIREENENLRQRKYALEVELAQLQHMNALDEALTVQVKFVKTPNKAQNFQKAKEG